MSVSFRQQNAILLAKPQSAAGTPSSPVVGSDAIRAEPAQHSITFDKEQTNFARGTISASAPIINGGGAGLRVSTRLMGSAAAGTVAPDVCTLLRGCAMSQTLLAADATGTAQAGAAGSLTLASGASAVTNAYKGWILETTGGTGPSQRRVVTAYNGTTKAASVYPDFAVTPDDTTTYAVRKGALMTPISVGQELLTLFNYRRNSTSGGNALLEKVVDAMGDYNIGISAKKTAKLDVTFQGVLPAAPTGVADPGLATLAGVDPQPYIGALTYLGGLAIKFNEFSFGGGNKVSAFADPAATYGVDSSEIIERMGAGKINIPKSLPATMDAVSDWIGAVSKPLWMCWGATGKGVSLYYPGARYVGNDRGVVDGFETEGLPFQPTGDDGEVYICLF